MTATASTQESSFYLWRVLLRVQSSPFVPTLRAGLRNFHFFLSWLLLAAAAFLFIICRRLSAVIMFMFCIGPLLELLELEPLPSLEEELPLPDELLGELDLSLDLDEPVNQRGNKNTISTTILFTSGLTVQIK